MTWILRCRFALVVSIVAAAASYGCAPSSSEIGVATHVPAKLDVSPFSRVLVAGFVSGGMDDVEANEETVRVLRSQLRRRSDLGVVDAPVFVLADRRITDDRDMSSYGEVFANAAYWKAIGTEYNAPLIVTGTVYFALYRQQVVIAPRNVFSAESHSAPSMKTTGQLADRNLFTLASEFVFIDGRTGERIYSESIRRTIVYDAQVNVPPLSTYFELMDRIVPEFLHIVSAQDLWSARVLLK